MKKEQSLSVFDLPVPEKIFLLGRVATPVNGQPYLQFVGSFTSLEVAKDVLVRLEYPARIVEYMYQDLSQL